MLSHLKRLWDDDSGQAMVEYGVIIAVVAVAAVAILMLFWNKIDGLFGKVADQMDATPGTFTADLK